MARPWGFEFSSAICLMGASRRVLKKIDALSEFIHPVWIAWVPATLLGRKVGIVRVVEPAYSGECVVSTVRVAYQEIPVHCEVIHCISLQVVPWVSISGA